MNASLIVALLLSTFLGGESAQMKDSVNFAGDLPKAKEVWRMFETWLAAYSRGDLKGVLEIFDREVQFSFQGMKDQGYSDLQASYVQDFQSRDPGSEWVPVVEEVYADARLAFVRSVWELRVKAADGKTGIKSRNRSMDVLRPGTDGKWVIFRSLNYPAGAGH